MEFQVIKLLKNSFTRFLLVGVLNTTFGYSIFALLIYVGFHYTLSILVATVLGVIFNFKTIGKLVFKNDNNTLILKFVGVYCISYLLNIGGLRILEIFRVNMFLAGAFMLLPTAIVSYLLNKKFVFELLPAESIQYESSLDCQEIKEKTIT